MAITRSIKAALGALLSSSLLLALATGPAQAQVREYNLKFGTSLAQDHPQTVGARKFAELVDKKSHGKIKSRVFGMGVLGTDQQMVSALQGGTLDFVAPGASILVGQIKEFSIVDFPFLFNSNEEADKVFDGPFGQKLLDKLPEKGLVGLGWWENGYRHTTNSKHPITKWEDFQGLKIRTMQSPVMLDLFNGLGANATPMAFNEVYTALETKTVDAQENPVAIVSSSKFYEVQKYLSLTRHAYNPFAFLMSKKTWDKMNADERKIITEAANETKAFERKISRDQEARNFEALKKAGMQINDVKPQELARMSEKARVATAKHAAAAGENLLKELYAEIDKARARP
jgi:tripartite ATP-independent transporter DctP family solute receptor